MAKTLATVAIISIGDMGLGIAKLLAANKYNVVTNVTGRRSNNQNHPFNSIQKTRETDSSTVKTPSTAPKPPQ